MAVEVFGLGYTEAEPTLPNGGLNAGCERKDWWHEQPKVGVATDGDKKEERDWGNPKSGLKHTEVRDAP